MEVDSSLLDSSGEREAEGRDDERALAYTTEQYSTEERDLLCDAFADATPAARDHSHFVREQALLEYATHD